MPQSIAPALSALLVSIAVPAMAQYGGQSSVAQNPYNQGYAALPAAAVPSYAVPGMTVPPRDSNAGLTPQANALAPLPSCKDLAARCYRDVGRSGVISQDPRQRYQGTNYCDGKLADAESTGTYYRFGKPVQCAREVDQRR
jgi:hypothetical protein